MMSASPPAWYPYLSKTSAAASIMASRVRTARLLLATPPPQFSRRPSSLRAGTRPAHQPNRDNPPRPLGDAVTSSLRAPALSTVPEPVRTGHSSIQGASERYSRTVPRHLVHR